MTKLASGFKLGRHVKQQQKQIRKTTMRYLKSYDEKHQTLTLAIPKINANNMAVVETFSTRASRAREIEIGPFLILEEPTAWGNNLYIGVNLPRHTQIIFSAIHNKNLINTERLSLAITDEILIGDFLIITFQAKLKSNFE